MLMQLNGLWISSILKVTKEYVFERSTGSWSPVRCRLRSARLDPKHRAYALISSKPLFEGGRARTRQLWLSGGKQCLRQRAA